MIIIFRLCLLLLHLSGIMLKMLDFHCIPVSHNWSHKMFNRKYENWKWKAKKHEKFSNKIQSNSIEYDEDTQVDDYSHFHKHTFSSMCPPVSQLFFPFTVSFLYSLSRYSFVITIPPYICFNYLEYDMHSNADTDKQTIVFNESDRAKKKKNFFFISFTVSGWIAVLFEWNLCLIDMVCVLNDTLMFYFKVILISLHEILNANMRYSIA